MTRSAPDRVLAIDVLRGFALMGLFLIHMIEYFELYWYGSDQEGGLIRTVVMTIFSGKAYSLFALLFGVSFYLLLERRGTASAYTPLRFLWRMVLLAGIGYLHSLIYPGDILQQLALCGVFLLSVHRMPSWVLVLLVIVFLGRIASTIQFAIALQDESYRQPLFWEWSQRNFEVFVNADIGAYLSYTATQGQIAKWVLIAETGSIWNLLGLFVAGLLLARLRLFENIHSAGLLRWALAGTVVLGFAIKMLSNYLMPFFPELMPRWCFETVSGGLFNLSMVAFYVVGVLLLLRVPIAGRILAVLAPAGRMSLTFYFGQSLVFIPVFYGFGMGLHASLGQRNALLIGIVAWGLQLVIAHLWFRRFRHGPFEGIWRWMSLTPGSRRS